MTSVLEAITKLPRFIDQNTAIVDKYKDKYQYGRDYYNKNKKWISKKKKIYNDQHEQHIKEYRKRYYLAIKQQLRLKQREYLNRKDGNGIQMS